MFCPIPIGMGLLKYFRFFIDQNYSLTKKFRGKKGSLDINPRCPSCKEEL